MGWDGMGPSRILSLVARGKWVCSYAPLCPTTPIFRSWKLTCIHACMHMICLCQLCRVSRRHYLLVLRGEGGFDTTEPGSPYSDSQPLIWAGRSTIRGAPSRWIVLFRTSMNGWLDGWMDGSTWRMQGQGRGKK